MNDATFNATDLMLTLNISLEEADGLLDGFFEFREGEMRKLAAYKGITLEDVEEFFRVIE